MLTLAFQTHQCTVHASSRHCLWLPTPCTHTPLDFREAGTASKGREGGEAERMLLTASPPAPSTSRQRGKGPRHQGSHCCGPASTPLPSARALGPRQAHSAAVLEVLSWNPRCIGTSEMGSAAPHRRHPTSGHKRLTEMSVDSAEM